MIPKEIKCNYSQPLTKKAMMSGDACPQRAFMNKEDVKNEILFVLAFCCE